ncbi:MAG: chromosome partition protein MukB, partial [Myxococcales bacterium]|nr:chromosome partition protein MukB [Myxococcales bacterium]
LVERLRRARDAAQVAAAVEAHPPEPEGDLEAWRLTREWLRRCLPARLADTPDPRLGLERLSEHLTALEGRLHHQEQVLAGSAADVAHYVRQLRRRARRQVDRLNELLAPIAFGSIAGVRLQMTDVEQMEALLDGLSDQADLFKPGLPIDEALDRLFQRVGGTPGSARLLDYREYFDLQVHVQRQSDPTWRLANPTRMSTGEAIGVGAALMMVVLHAWEAQNRLSRKQSDLNTLRLLFLDEANRLSADNLGVLIDLCRTLELQLLIAAPRVDEAAGNTTYRLARVTTPDGREEVRLTGRRVRAGASLVDRLADPDAADVDFDPPPWRDPPAADD